MGRIWLLEKQNLVLLSNGGSKKSGRINARGNRVADAKVKNGVLHIVAPQRGYLLKPQKLREKCQELKRQKELLKRKE